MRTISCIVRIPSSDGDAESAEKQSAGAGKSSSKNRKVVARQQPRSVGTPIKVIGVGGFPRGWRKATELARERERRKRQERPIGGKRRMCTGKRTALE